MTHSLKRAALRDPATNLAPIASMAAPYSWRTWLAFVWLGAISGRCPLDARREAVDTIWGYDGPDFDWERALRLGRAWARLPRPQTEEAAA